MKKKQMAGSSRRKFIQSSSLAAAGFFIVPRHVLGRGHVAPSDKLNVAGIGVGGKGWSDLSEFAKSPNVNIVALADVDDRQSEKARKKWPNAKYYKDYREMLAKENKNFDACSISTPDNVHAVATTAAALATRDGTVVVAALLLERRELFTAAGHERLTGRE